ncbi:CdaR family protein [Aequorivita marisscotiae]|uniref:CdaR family protein n=1 Tax=Aequorivita marisscotiae TaxID=3040348 RepID=A0ABY8KVM4_9FLAO|nr:YbbR-like domain-containing protein [Aequorivita sp. Ant34-E75]WGF92574.1 CdaR family protein [Aequorivita sp. Ant34-E75]
MTKGIFKKNKNLKIKRFLFFLLIAAIFWILTKFSREFTTTMEAKINYENIPETTALSEKNLHTIMFDLTANGFEILFYKFKKPRIDVQVSEFYDNEKDHFTISKNELSRMVSSNFNRNLGIKNLSVEELKVVLDPIVLKKVKVVPSTKLSFKDGFKPRDSIKISPDSVTISGPSGTLKKINSIRTEEVSLNGIEKSISKSISLVSPNSEIVSIKPNTVTINLKVAEYSQGQFTLPIEVINLPPEMEIKLISPSVTVSYDVPVSEFTKISKENFRVICDYAKRNKDDNFMLPTLEKMPPGILNVVFEPKKIDFFIFK